MLLSATVAERGLHGASGPNTEARSEQHCRRLEGRMPPEQGSCLHCLSRGAVTQDAAIWACAAFPDTNDP